MGVRSAGLRVVLDHNFGPNMLTILRLSGVRPGESLTSLAELGIAGNTRDEDWMRRLGKDGPCVAVTRDGEILNASLRRAAWQASGISLLLLDKRWGSLPIHELVRSLLFWWPRMMAYAEAGKPGTAWTVSHKVPEAPESGIRLVTGGAPPSV